MAPGELILSAAARRTLCEHAEQGFPHEVVGILVGEPGRVESAVALVNERADSPRNRYHVSALALHRAELAVEASGKRVLGYYHSHPDHPAQYSDFDRDHALPNLSYLIVSVRGGATADLRCWWLREDRTAMDEQRLAFEENP